MICKPCREPHEPADCIDAVAVPPREGMTRWCYCQHAPRQDVALGAADTNAPESSAGTIN